MEENKIQEKIRQMTLEEKCSLLAGQDFWHTREIPRLGIPRTMLTDGPFGLRKQEKAADHLGLSRSNPAVCFPAGCALASSFDPELAREMGEELGALAQAEDVSVVLGPAMNIKRSPLCGRNFEYYSEDPLVSSEIGAGAIEGIQSRNVGASPKHFLANNQEYFRQTSNSVVDERALREIYLAAFEGAVKKAKPWTIMCSYNKINGTYACENKTFLTDILRKEWGFDGYVMTDWGACDDSVESVRAGMDLAMPGPGTDNVNRLAEAVRRGDLSEEAVDQAAARLLRVVFRYTESHEADAAYDFEQGHKKAARIARESAVLLKNEGKVLPLKEGEKVAFIGEYALAPRYQGGGSSHVNPYRVTGVWELVKDQEGASFARGFQDTRQASGETAKAAEELDARLRKEAAALAKAADKAVLFVGLPERFETEGVDRRHLSMPENQTALIEAVAAVQPNTIVVLHNGAPVEMPWLPRVRGVLEMYLAGEAAGEAEADLLYGRANPCGHLAETFPLRVEDTPAYPWYGVEREDVVYREGSFVGYRWYETRELPVLFPFGHGLSYTEFSYSDLKLDREAMRDDELLTGTVTVKNTGSRPGKALVQVYVSPCAAGLTGVCAAGAGSAALSRTAGPRPEIPRPLRELRAFVKVELAAGEEKTAAFSLDKRAFAFWDSQLHDWRVPEGDYWIQIGKSAREILLETAVHVTPARTPVPFFTINSPLGDLKKNPTAMGVMRELMGALFARSRQEAADTEENGIMSKETVEETSAAVPLHALTSFGADIRREQLQELVRMVNEALSREKDERTERNESI